ncbi:MAG: UDP-N-acetylmuramoyl-tripeptide--D-alanyl-D-alanine ligase [Clostridiales bacterium]|jgi:UDP-N-acetylmuramoyl-tripeptide--D-alanyl-D-alanine ligase|nr:UDP-N-acetylmuramoyl-tripeptide--D-alanyl-D-alanine ligase [Clostridiales bacterium]
MLKLFYTLSLLFFAAYLVRKSLYFLHMMQQNSYRPRRYLRWYFPRQSLRFSWWEWLPLLPLFAVAAGGESVFARGFLAASYLTLCLLYRRPRQKKPLVWTARAKRLCTAALFLLGSMITWLLLSPPYLFIGVGVLLIFTYLPLIPVLLGVLFIYPLESAINRRYFRQAQAKLAALSRLTTIGITGSFGKTSVKMILGEILSEKYTTLVTPSSFNTPMGLTRVIREQLRPTHEMFVAEMGAKQRGDIAELCRLTKPRLGIITALGAQHLETFGSIENIAATKFELIQSLPPKGLAILNCDDPLIAAQAKNSPCPVVRYGLSPELDYWAGEINYGAKGCSFLIHGPDQVKVSFQTKLLGRHNVYNILGAAAAAHQLGVSLEEAARAVKTLPPIEHRLQLRQGTADITIIDDAFNSNPLGAQIALEVLASFESGRKILITPGMIELGAKEDQLNREFSQSAALVCDYIILVGKKRIEPLKKGLEDANFPPERWTTVPSLTEAQKQLGLWAEAGDVVLFENDLPDTYSE